MKNIIIIISLTLVCFMNAAFAAPQKVNFQGKLTDAAGNPITASISMTFRMYDVASGGTALWTETQTVTVTNGIYNVLLGQVNPIDTELTETKALWLGVKVGTDAEMSPRTELTPGVYDLIILNVMTIKDGNIGLGTATPGTHVHIRESASGQIPTNVGGLFVENDGTDNDYYVFQTATVGGGKSFSITNAGKIGIGTTAPKAKLDIVGGTISAQNYDALMLQTIPNRGWKFITGQYAHPTYGDYPLIIQQDAVDESGNRYHGHFVIEGTLHVTGQDIAEPFEMNDIGSLELGDVVVMDPANPKHLTKSLTAYDHKVAGIVSSTEQAGYVAGSRSDGSSDKPVALTGRVLCKVSAENGKIEVGDLLTTSNTPGYAMKATDRDQAFGAVLGKALEPFDGDTGMILVLVALQ